MQDLPDDVLLAVADRAQCPAAAAVCRRWRALLWHRHLSVPREADLESAAAVAGGSGRVRTLVCTLGQIQYASAYRIGVALGPYAGAGLRRLSCRLAEGDLTALLAVAAACERLAVLEIACAASTVAVDAAQAIRLPQSLADVTLALPATRLSAPDLGRLTAALAGLPRLTAVDLDVRWNYELTGADMRVLAPLCRPDAGLRRLRLALSGCTWNGDAVLCALAVPPDTPPPGAPGLRELDLVLDDMDVGEWGAVHGLQALLDRHPALERLRLSAGDAPAGTTDRAVPRLIAAVAHGSRALRSLDLAFRSSHLADRGYFRPLGDLTRLETLRLDVSNNPRLGPRAARSVDGVLRACPLRCFHLCAENTGIRDVGRGPPVARSPGRPPLTALHLGGGCVRLPALLSDAVSPALEYLHLNLNAAVIGDRGCADLAAVLRGAPRLTHLALVAVRNGVGDAGARDLAAAVAALPRLHTLALEMGCNPVGTEGVAAALRAVAALGRLRHLHLDFAHSAADDRVGPALQAAAGAVGAQRFFFASPGWRGIAPAWTAA
jgi:hypothetical protein